MARAFYRLAMLFLTVFITALVGFIRRIKSWQCRTGSNFPNDPFLKSFLFNRSFQYFRFCADTPGMVVVRRERDGAEDTIRMAKSAEFTMTEEMPAELIPAGLSQERLSYLHRFVRPFVSPFATSLPQTSYCACMALWIVVLIVVLAVVNGLV